MTPRNTVLTSVLLSIATCGALLFTTAAKQPIARFDQIDVGRINIREPDGTLRMVISNRKQFPGSPWRGGEQARPDRTQFAGMLFINDEGTENGDLIFNGKRDAEGKVGSGVSLTFDRYQQDQQLQLLGVDGDGNHFAGMTVNDVADGVQRPITSERDEADNRAGKRHIVRRFYAGKTPGQSSVLQLADAQGRTRLMLLVSPAGEATIQFKDEAGAVVRELKADDLSRAK